MDLQLTETDSQYGGMALITLLGDLQKVLTDVLSRFCGTGGVFKKIKR